LLDYCVEEVEYTFPIGPKDVSCIGTAGEAGFTLRDGIGTIFAVGAAFASEGYAEGGVFAAAAFVIHA
jgi:hypothetical protein